MKHRIRVLINIILSKLGYKFIRTKNWKPKLKHDRLDIPNEVLIHVRNNSMLNDYRLINIVSSIEYLISNNIDGDMIECGVWKGGSVALMAHVLKENNQLRTLHLFDVFDEICEPDAEIDGERAVKLVGGLDNAHGRLRPVSGVYNNKGGSGNENQVYDLLTTKVGYDQDFIKIHKGWFQETLPIVEKQINNIALLRLDGDWYASTRVCLEYLYEKVRVGGIVIIDDYGAYDGCQKAIDEFLGNLESFPYFHYVDDECIFWIKQ